MISTGRAPGSGSLSLSGMTAEEWTLLMNVFTGYLNFTNCSTISNGPSREVAQRLLTIMKESK